MSNEAYNGQLDQFNYQELAQRTSAPATPELIERLTNPRTMYTLVDLLSTMSALGRKLDELKKHVFYNKLFSNPGENLNHEIGDGQTQLLVNENGRRIKVFHGIIGIITEAGEMADILLGFLCDYEDFDFTNIKEEAGDNLWYLAELLSGSEANFNQVQRSNIAKLAARYGDKFSDYRAINRDLEAERVALEADIHEKTQASET